MNNNNNNNNRCYQYLACSSNRQSFRCFLSILAAASLHICITAEHLLIVRLASVNMQRTDMWRRKIFSLLSERLWRRTRRRKPSVFTISVWHVQSHSGQRSSLAVHDINTLYPPPPAVEYIYVTLVLLPRDKVKRSAMYNKSGNWWLPLTLLWVFFRENVAF